MRHPLTLLLWGDNTKLLQHPQCIRFVPHLDDLTVRDPVYSNPRVCHLLARQSGSFSSCLLHDFHLFLPRERLTQE